MGANGLDIWVLLAVSIGILALFVLFIITILFIYQRKTFEHRRKLTGIEENRKQEILKTQIEVQDETLQYVSREIHDNIGQVLSFVKLSLGIAAKDPSTSEEKIKESRELLSNAISDLRDLSKSMSFDIIKASGLAETIKYETEKINKSGLLLAKFNLTGIPVPIEPKHELVLFRIFQESVNNVLKHANAKNLTVDLTYADDLRLTITDDGDGFYMGIIDQHKGSGLKNMQNRAGLIGANADIVSENGHGCKVTLNYTLQHEPA
ncbi:sensor histidine kinase [Mucilaginibacter ginkgonis]|uniref:histidine kinase n=1 Tax=Mucilaginibacter ginkgonis TaxID=2682091 RepID=A0A6I4HXP4_9SPHI|nr:sensor histidine kinase [Mucilaginibacter ginkgonis]QQL49277.1 sensor histidine kinase [Mucilaginibacter ginkgonis]